jgi:hypothetical protein
MAYGAGVQAKNLAQWRTQVGVQATTWRYGVVVHDAYQTGLLLDWGVGLGRWTREISTVSNFRGPSGSYMSLSASGFA